ncbi:MAG TPA: TetR/AcrR family transcriptional regulator [Terracidiphilus sp.]
MKPTSHPKPSAKHKSDGYHHGDLRAALLKSAEEIIRESGLEGLTLRACARKAGVSHGAPAHHFGNVTGLLTELAAEGFERLAEAMDPTRVKNADDDLETAGLGYIQFAMTWPEHFRVMYHSELLDQQSPRLRLARESAERIVRHALIHVNENWTRKLSGDELAARFETAWCCVYGYASLWVEGSRKSRSLDEARRMLRVLRPALVRE